MPDDAGLAPAQTRPDDAPIRCALMTRDPQARPRPEVGALIERIQTRYHDTHRREFPEAIALARKLQNMPMRDKGILTQLASQFTAEYFREHGQGATGTLLEVAIDAYVELMCQVGLIHTIGQSEETTRRRLVGQFPEFVTMFQAVEQRIGSLMAQLVNDQLGEELVRLDGLLNDERELMSGAAERAQADATAERRRADALQAKLEQVKAQAAAREADLLITV